jgi:predicted nucleic acid-binding Zn ribbon protein
MFRRHQPATADGPAANAVDVTQPHDTCVRCGAPTPLGVSLCERDNPGRIKSPSATQVHGTIVVGVLIGFVLLIFVMRYVFAGLGPFASTLDGVATRSDGGLDVVVSVTNNGSRTAGASCRVSPNGAPADTDYVFFTSPLAPGETRQFSQTVTLPVGQQPFQSSNVLVRCT